MKTETRYLWAVGAALLATTACSRSIEVEPQIESRVDTCEKACEQTLGPCGPGPSPTFDTVPECMTQCSTAKGVFSRAWGYQADTETDECAAEFRADVECINALSCDDQLVLARGQVNSLPIGERPCYDEIQVWSHCMSEAEAAR